MTKAKIKVGDWYMYRHNGATHLCTKTCYDGSDFNIQHDNCAWDAERACVKLPAPPKDLIRCWKLTEKIANSFGSASEYENVKRIALFMSKSKRAKQARGK